MAKGPVCISVPVTEQIRKFYLRLQLINDKNCPNFVEMQESQVFYSLSKLLSTSTFRKLIVEREVDFLQKKVNKHKSLLQITPKSTNRDVIKNIYELLDQNYRFEYLYKNHLLNKLVEEKKISETVILNELRVGTSIADTVFINGESVLYEVKTELDNPQKLVSQIGDYQRAFAKIYVVTHETIYYKYYQILKGTNIGLIYLSKENILITHKPAVCNFDNLDHTILFKLLRKSEFTAIIENYFGEILDVPNTLLFKYCLELAKEIPINFFYEGVFQQLKTRKNLTRSLFNSNKTPRELKYICYMLDFDTTNYQDLHEFLRSPFKS